MKNAWTIGQYSIYRVVLGLYLLQHFVGLLPWGAELFSSEGVLPDKHLSPLIKLFPNIFLVSDSPLFVIISLGTGAALSVLFIIGKFDRIAAVLIWYLWACLYARNPLIGNPSLPFIGWLLLAHLLVPSAGKSEDNDAICKWQLPGDLYLAAWILMSLAYTYSGYTKLVSPSWVDGSALSRVLANPLARDTALRTLLLSLPAWILKLATWAALGLELSFAPLALFRRMRPLIWLAMVSLHLGLLLLINFSDLTVGMLILHLFTFDPAWIPSPQLAGQTIFFDGHCGLCHGFVRFVLREDRSPQPFSFAPLQGESLQHALPQGVPSGLPDSVIVISKSNAEGHSVLTRSSAVVYVLKRLGGLWFFAALLLNLVPRPVRDFGYDIVSRVRLKIFGASPSLCPLVGPQWSARFLP